ncbi:MAG: porin [Rhodocyclaceae bacterium]
MAGAGGVIFFCESCRERSIAAIARRKITRHFPFGILLVACRVICAYKITDGFFHGESCVMLRRTRWVRVACVAVLVMLGTSFPAAAESAAEDSQDALTVRGFGTLGLARSSSDQAEFVRDLSQPSGASTRWTGKLDSVLGLQLNARATERLEGVVQVVSRYRYDGNFRPELTWAFARFDANAYLSLRAGRLGTEFYMLADSRLVGYSYLTVRPPSDYFGALPFTYVDGADATETIPLGSGLLRGKLFSGVTREKLPLADRVWDIGGSRMTGVHLDYQIGAWSARLGYSTIRFNHDLPVGDLVDALSASGVPMAQDAARQLSVAGKRSHFYSLGIVYDKGAFQSQLMLSRTRQESRIFENSRAGYLLAGYRVQQVTPFLGYSWVNSTPRQLTTGLPNVPPLNQLNAALAATLADSHSRQSTIFVGARWDVQRNIALKAQLDVVRGTPASIFPVRWEKPGWNGRTNVLSLTMDVVF